MYLDEIQLLAPAALCIFKPRHNLWRLHVLASVCAKIRAAQKRTASILKHWGA